MQLNRIPTMVFWLALLGLAVLLSIRVLGNVGGRAAATL